MIRFFERNSTKLTISEFYENYTSGKYNFSAQYQRNSDVWNEDKKSFLIDSIFKNYPIPAIFMRPNVNNQTGKTEYDIIDGKQRLEAVIAFIENSIPLTTYFAEDCLVARSNTDTGIDEKIAGLSFSEIKASMHEFSVYIKQFWTYSFTVEYLYEDNEELISNVFDRLNRNGEPLSFQELRNAKYNSSDLLTVIKSLSTNEFWEPKLEKLDSIRMEDNEFISELFFLTGENNIFASSPAVLDTLYEKYTTGEKSNSIVAVQNKFNQIVDFIVTLNLNFTELKKLTWATHLYGLFSFAWYCVKASVVADDVKDKVCALYQNYFNRSNPDIENPAMKKYKESCSSRTRSDSQRKNRLISILEYCKVQHDI